MKFEKSCGAVVFRYKEDQFEFLLVKSKANNHWGFPKGHMENTESEEETAHREVFEETGIKINILSGFRKKIEYKIENDITKTVVYFIGQTKDLFVNIQEEEIIDFKWNTYEKSYSKLTYDSDKLILDEAICFLGGQV